MDATRPEINDTQEFKRQFREKYWSESTQNVVRNDISNGRYESQGGHTLTSYFLGKVCLARNLEPKIPEESLVIQLGYHYEEAIQKARRQGQIKTIQGMASLLEDLENDGQYRKNRIMNQRYNKWNEHNNTTNFNVPYNHPQNNNRNNWGRNHNNNNEEQLFNRNTQHHPPNNQPGNRGQQNHHQGNQDNNRNSPNNNRPNDSYRGAEPQQQMCIRDRYICYCKSAK